MAGGKLISTGVEFPDATTQTTSGLPLTGGTMTGALTTTGFTSTGIDDNATSTAITIDASENVSIGGNNLTLGDGTSITSLRLLRNSANYITATNAAGYLVFRAGGDTERARIDSSGKLIVNGGMIQLNGNELGGAQVFIADDTVATINAPRYGGYMFINVSGESGYPAAIGNLFYYDCGPSTHIYESSGFSGTSGNLIDPSTATLTGTTGTNGKITVSPTSSKTIQIENRHGVNRWFQVTFL